MIIRSIDIFLIIVSVILLVRLLQISKKQNNTYFIMMFVTSIIVNLGYYFTATASTVEEIYLATKLIYLDGTFMMTFMIMGMCQICNINLNRVITAVMLLMDFEVMISVFTVGKIGWHYEHVEINTELGFTYLEKSYGPHHTVYLIYVIIKMLIPFGIVVYSMMQRRKSSWLYTLLLGIGQTVTVLTYFIERAVGLKFEILPFAIILCQIMILVILQRIALYDVAQIGMRVLESIKESGYVILDWGRRFVGCDDVARKFFPELNELAIDRGIYHPFLRNEFGKWVEESREKEVEPKYFERCGATVKVTVNVINNKEGKKPIGFLLQIVDDTQNQKYIARLKELAYEAETANNAKSVFLSNMSHEIRTPINAVLGMNEMIIRESRDEQIREYASNIDESGKMLLSIVNDILDFSKIESGKMTLLPSEYKLSNLLNDVVNMNRPKAEEKQLIFSLTADENIPDLLFGDEIRIKQVLTKLISNAIKYTEGGSINVEVLPERTDSEEVLLYFGIRDTGKGIKVEEKKKIINSFQKYDEKPGLNIEGSGLGLAITKNFVSMMGGEIGFESEYGKGSLFFIKIPQKIRGTEPVGDYRKKSAAYVKEKIHEEYREKFTAPDARVLIVDDTKVNIIVFKGLLKKTKMIIDSAESGEKALAMCEKTKYDVIYLDHMMPGMDGIETLGAMRHSNSAINNNTPVLAMTANAIAGAKEMYLKAGFTDYISKPIDPDILEKSLLDYLPVEKIIQ